MSARPPTPTKADSFPEVSSFAREDAERVNTLIDEDLAYQEQEAAVKEARKAVKAELIGLARKYETGGMRAGSVVVYYEAGKTKRTLDRTLLVENGCPADVVAASYRESAPWEEVRVVDTSRPRKGRAGDGEE